MAWLSGVLDIIKAIPTLVTVIKSIWDAYNEMKAQIERNRLNAEMKAALEAGDKKKVEELFGNKP